MTSPSLIAAARSSADRHERIIRMAHLMRHHREGPEGACTALHLYQAGYTEAEVVAYRDDARACLLGKPSLLRNTPPYRLKGQLLAMEARRIQARNERRPWAAPVVEQIDG